MLNLKTFGELIFLQGGGGLVPLTVIVVLVAGGLIFALRAASKTKMVEGFDVALGPSKSRRLSTLMKRYRDAYIVARVTNGFGAIIKTIGIIAGGLLALIGFMAASKGGPNDPMSVLGIVGIVVAILIGGLFYILGILVAAHGQILKASLDTAVNSSPFLTNDNKAMIMSLPEE
jgi:hypothetical protein